VRLVCAPSPHHSVVASVAMRSPWSAWGVGYAQPHDRYFTIDNAVTHESEWRGGVKFDDTWNNVWCSSKIRCHLISKWDEQTSWNTTALRTYPTALHRRGHSIRCNGHSGNRRTSEPIAMSDSSSRKLVKYLSLKESIDTHS
jgi:hypothetical protein